MCILRINIFPIVVKKSNRRRRLAVNLVPFVCAAAVEYSRTRPHRTHRKTRLCLAMHPPMQTSRFAWLAKHYQDGVFRCAVVNTAIELAVSVLQNSGY